MDPALLWLWRRSAAVVLTGSLAWEHPYASGEALRSKKKKKKKKNQLYFCNEGFEKETKKIILFTKTTRKIKYLGIILIKEVQSLLSEN